MSITQAMAALMPPADAEESAYPPAFQALAELLLNRSILHIQGRAHRFTEIEFYYKGRQHVDKFTHGDPMQKRFGHWYFHRTGGEYRSGTYKGVDIAFGSDDAPAGILIRGVEEVATGELIDGPCMVVDHMLARTGAANIPALVSRFDLRIEAEDDSSPLRITHHPEGNAQPQGLGLGSQPRKVYESPRVGLSLKRANTPERHRFIARPYRFLTEPARIKKGKPHMVIGMHRQGEPAARIAAATGSRLPVIERYLEAYQQGLEQDPASFGGELSTNEICALFGACEKAMA